jgi:hypothetical protein
MPRVMTPNATDAKGNQLEWCEVCQIEHAIEPRPCEE